MNQKDAKQTLARVGVTLQKRDGEYRLNHTGFSNICYHTQDLIDAVTTGLAMAKERDHKAATATAAGPLALLRHHVSGAIARGEGQAIAGQPITTKQLFRVEMLFSYGWDDAGWNVDDGSGPKPERFTSVTAANEEIADHCRTMRGAIRAGDMQGPADKPEDFRVVPTMDGQKKHLRGGWSVYPIAPNAVGNFVEDLGVIASLLGSILYITKLRDGVYYIRRFA